MSLEGDLLMPPRGPLKWRWLTEMLTKLSKAAGILSPDGSVQINPTTGGVTLYTPPTATTGRIDIRPVGSDRYRVPALTFFDGIDFSEIGEQEVTLRENEILCLRYAYTLALFQNPDAEPVTLVSISVSDLEYATTAKPTNETPVAGLIYIPLAMRQDGFVIFAKQTTISLDNYVTLKFSMG
jgi:hypothetical protein